MSTASLMVDSSGAVGGITSADLKLLPDPVRTRTHHPVACHVLDDMMQHRLRKEFGVAVEVLPQFALNRTMTQIFGVYALRYPNESGLLPAMAFRSSIDKSLQPKIAGGGRVWVCTNTCVWGDLLEVMRKQTKDSMEEIETMIIKVCAKLESHFHSAELEVEVMQDMEVNDRRGYAVLGELFGTGVLTPNQMTRAFRTWKKPGIEDFKPRSAWSLYNSVTEGLKVGQPGHMMGRYMRLHQDFRQRYVNAFGESVVPSLSQRLDS